jgi:hypothetical protein
LLEPLQDHLSKEDVTKFLRAARENPQIRNAFGVPDIIHGIAQARELSASRLNVKDDIPF